MYAAPPALNLVVIRSTDVERAKQFYAAMGLPMSRDSLGSVPSHYVSVVCGLVFEIYALAPGQAPTTGTRLGFRWTPSMNSFPCSWRQAAPWSSSPGTSQGDAMPSSPTSTVTESSYLRPLAGTRWPVVCRSASCPPRTSLVI
jgi:hypothetical protein